MAKRVFKTLKQGNLNKTYRAWEDFKTGDTVVGELVAFHLDKYGKHSPVIKVLNAEFKDTKVASELEGKNLVLNHCGSLANCFGELDIDLDSKESRDAAIGSGIQAEYGGTSTVKNGKFKGQECHIVTANLVDLNDDGYEEEASDEDIL